VSANAKNSRPAKLSSTATSPGPRLPPLKALLAFSAAARHGSFARGAAELGVTPSAISHHIQQLETFLGARLFQRHAGRAVMTSAGKMYADEAERAFRILAEATVRVAPQAKQGHLVVASSPSFAAKWLQPRLADFLATHPDTRIRISTISESGDLEATRFDIAVVHGVRPDTKRQVEPLLTERLRPLCSPTLAAELDLRCPADLVRATLIHSMNAATWSDYFREIGQEGIRPAREIWLDRSTMALDAAVSGLGVALESELLAAEELKAGMLVAPFGDELSARTTNYHLIRSTSQRNRALSDCFEKWMRDELAVATKDPSAPTAA
jgi:LysR family transcriptional regulator, glycine cleavage system transcriptional activator